MARKHLLPLAAGLVLVTAVPVAAESPPLVPGDSKGTDPEETTWQGLTIPTEPVLPAVERHPSLMFDAGDLPKLRRKASGAVRDPHGFYESRWDKIKTDADAALLAPIDANDDVKTRSASALAFAWSVTGDPRYRAAAVENLKQAYTTIQTDDLYVGLQLTNYALAYDWVAGEGISAEDDAEMRAAIRRGAQWIRTYLADPGTRPHNHRSKAALALALWSLAFSGEPEAEEWLGVALDNVNQVFRYQFTQDGIYREGGYYWVFTLTNLIPFLHAYKNVSGVDLFTRLQPAFEAELKTSTPEGWLPNVEDGWYKNTWLVTVASAYRRTPTTMSRTATLGQLFQWRFFDSAWSQVRYDANWTGSRNQYYGWPQEFVLYDSTIAEREPDTKTVEMAAGPRGGATVFRDGWSRNGTWAYFNGVAMSDNHDHADALQVIIHAKGSVLGYDPGYGPGRFSKRAGWAGAERHNVVTADGAALGDPTPTSDFLDTPWFGFAEKSAAYHSDPQAVDQRSLAFVGGDYFVITDQLSAAASKTWAYRYRNRGVLTGDGEGRWTWTTTPGPWGDAASMHSLLLPGTATTTQAADQFNGYGDNKYVDGPGYPDPSTDLETAAALTSVQTGEKSQYMQVLVPTGADAAAPQLSDLSSGETLAARVRLGSATDTFLTRQTAGTSTAGELTATATWAWTRISGGTVKSWAVRDGSELRSGDELLLRSSVPITATGEVSRLGTRVQIADTDAEYTLDLGHRPVSARFNGSPVRIDGTTVTLRGGGDLKIVWLPVSHGG